MAHQITLISAEKCLRESARSDRLFSEGECFEKTAEISGRPLLEVTCAFFFSANTELRPQGNLFV